MTRRNSDYQSPRSQGNRQPLAAPSFSSGGVLSLILLFARVFASELAALTGAYNLLTHQYWASASCFCLMLWFLLVFSSPTEDE